MFGIRGVMFCEIDDKKICKVFWCLVCVKCVVMEFDGDDMWLLEWEDEFFGLLEEWFEKFGLVFNDLDKGNLEDVFFGC